MVLMNSLWEFEGSRWSNTLWSNKCLLFLYRCNWSSPKLEPPLEDEERRTFIWTKGYDIPSEIYDKESYEDDESNALFDFES